eukprot:641838-Hanusia_phi.AAC.1
MGQGAGFQCNLDLGGQPAAGMMGMETVGVMGQGSIRHGVRAGQPGQGGGMMESGMGRGFAEAGSRMGQGAVAEGSMGVGGGPGAGGGGGMGMGQGGIKILQQGSVGAVGGQLRTGGMAGDIGAVGGRMLQGDGLQRGGNQVQGYAAAMSLQPSHHGDLEAGLGMGGARAGGAGLGGLDQGSDMAGKHMGPAIIEGERGFVMEGSSYQGSRMSN